MRFKWILQEFRNLWFEKDSAENETIGYERGSLIIRLFHKNKVSIYDFCIDIG